jgi:hypothetical protein
MKMCPLFKKKNPCNVELQMEATRQNIEKTNSQLDEMKATLDGELDWFLVVESSDARERERERRLTHVVEEVCTAT